MVCGFMLVTFQCFASGTKEDTFIGRNLQDLEKELGIPSTKNEKTIDADYLGYESEPDYSKYFTNEELQLKVTVNIVSWKKRNRKIIIWFKKSSGDWIAFSSLEYSEKTSF